MTLHDKQVHFSRMFAFLVLHAALQDWEVVIDMVARSEEEQARLVAAGASQTMDSKHRERLAGDLLLFDDEGTYLTDTEEYAALGAFWHSLDAANVWGGDWSGYPDGGHFEYAG
jgi:peptidoglycan L-alanyl-D-glutamate endopeptidase CwlK